MPEYDMKATFTYNFAAYTERPESSRGNFNVCTLNEEDIGQALRKFEGKSLHGRRLVFDVNLEPCRQAKLKPSSTLLRLARSVKKLP